MTYPINPYVAGTVLRGERGFFGRQDTLRWVAQELQNPASNALVLIGQRRIGKTSLLMQLQRTLPDDRFLPVYFDLQDQSVRPLAQVLADLADTVAERAKLESPDPDTFDDAGHHFLRAFLPRVHRALGNDRRLVLLLDEFDVLDRIRAADLPDTAAAHTLLPLVRRVIGTDTRLAFIFAVGRRAEDLSLDFTATFRTSLVREIWVLDRASAESLVRQAETNGTLRFSAGAVAHVLDLTSGHPYLTQLLCQRVWERAYRTGPTAVPRIGKRDVEAAVPDALAVGEQAMIWVWNGLTPAERVYAAALAGLLEAGQGTSVESVLEALSGCAARLLTREVELAPRDLVQRRVLAPIEAGGHRFAVELFRRWVCQNRPLRDVKEELDRIEPAADRLYQMGRDFFKRREWDSAIRYFRDALAAYPNHFRARLQLGEALLELGESEEAVAELRQAYALDQDVAKFALARALARSRAPSEAPPLLVDDDQQQVSRGTEQIHLSSLEYVVLRELARADGAIAGKEQLSRAAQLAGHSGASIDAAIYRLRKKLGDSARSPTYLETRRGKGYILHHAALVSTAAANPSSD